MYWALAQSQCLAYHPDKEDYSVKHRILWLILVFAVSWSVFLSANAEEAIVYTAKDIKTLDTKYKTISTLSLPQFSVEYCLQSTWSGTQKGDTYEIFAKELQTRILFRPSTTPTDERVPVTEKAININGMNATWKVYSRKSIQENPMLPRAQVFLDTAGSACRIDCYTDNLVTLQYMLCLILPYSGEPTSSPAPAVTEAPANSKQQRNAKTRQSVEMRASPSNSAKVVLTLRANRDVTILREEANGWVYIEVVIDRQKKTGYVPLSTLR